MVHVTWMSNLGLGKTGGIYGEVQSLLVTVYTADRDLRTRRQLHDDVANIDVLPE